MGVWVKGGCTRNPAQTITTEWTAEKCLDKSVQSKQTSKHKLGKQTNRRSKVHTLAAQIARSSLSSNGNNAKDNID